MSKQTLPTNYKNTEYASGTTIQKFNMIQNSDGTVSFEDVTDYSQVGSTFGADELNATNEAVNASADKSDILDSAVAINANTTNGKMAGAYGVKELLIGGLSPVTFTRASSRSNIASGETLATLFGKISKWFADLGYAAFRNVANNLTTSSGGSYVLDAYQGKVLNDKITTINSNLTELSATLSDMSHIKVYGPMIRSVTAGAKSLTIVQLDVSDDITNVLNRLGCTSILGFTVTKGGYADQWQVTVTRYDDNNVYAQIYSKYGSSLTANITYYMLCI